MVAEELDPHSAWVSEQKAILMITTRQLDGAKVALEHMREFGGPDFEFHYRTWLAWMYSCVPDSTSALHELAKAEEIINSRKDPGFMPVDAGIHFALAGAKNKTKQTLDELRRRGLLDGFAPSGNMYLAMAHGLIGEYDECFRLLNLACENHIQLEAMQIWRLEPAFEPVRRDPRFSELLKNMNLA